MKSVMEKAAKWDKTGRKDHPAYKIDRTETGTARPDPEFPMFSIGTASMITELNPGLISLYEQAGLIRPFKRGGRRYFSHNDLQWISCISGMVKQQGLELACIKKMLEIIPCWEIANCPAEKRVSCSVWGVPVSN